MNASCRLLTPPPSGGAAIAAVAIGGDVQGVLTAIGAGTAEVGAVVLRNLGGVDRGLVARWSDRSATLMPHAGPQVVRELIGVLRRAGVRLEAGADWRRDFPEARDEVEARMLGALARAASPLAVDVLLDQPARWRAWQRGGGLEDDAMAARSAILSRLIDPPLVVALGRPNIGKSTLVNALAGRCVAIAADEPGTTRDHVGVLLDLGGLVVRWVDTPGIREGGGDVEQRAREIGIGLIRFADLLVLCRDAVETFPEVGLQGRTLRVGLRSDKGHSPAPCDVQVSTRTGAGLAELVGAVREGLVPEAVLRHPGPWRVEEGPIPRDLSLNLRPGGERSTRA